MLPQVAYYEPSVFDAIVAVGLLDASLRRGHSSDAATRHYNKAIQALHARLESAGESQKHCQDVVLLCCLLCTVFEILIGSTSNALRHITGGVKLLMEWSADEAQADHYAYLNRTGLLPMFLALDSQAVQLGVIGFREFTSLPAIATSQDSASVVFANPEEAHLVLNQIFNRVTRWAHWVPPSTAIGTKPDEEWMKSEKERLRSQLDQWDSAFSGLPNSVDSEAAILVLQVQRRVMESFFAKQADGPSEMRWDKYLPHFQEAMQDAERYVEVINAHTMNSTTTATTQQRPVFTMAMDIVMSLFLICAKCRDRVVRRRALAMLKSCRRTEGIWESHACARVCERMIELEEAGALEDGTIPEHARIYQIDVTLDGEHGAEITHKKWVGKGCDAEYEEIAHESVFGTD